MPACTASWSWKAGTTAPEASTPIFRAPPDLPPPRWAAAGVGTAGPAAPEASTSICRRPPDMSFTRLAKSLQNSWKMSRFGQVDWNFQVVVWARETWGAATVAAARGPATCRKWRRDFLVATEALASADLSIVIVSSLYPLVLV